MNAKIKTVLLPFPTLNTPRLILRALRKDDFDDLYEYASDPEMTATCRGIVITRCTKPVPTLPIICSIRWGRHASMGRRASRRS